MNKDLVHNIDAVPSINPIARSATGTGAAVDLRGYGSALALVNFGAYTDGTHTPSLMHSADGTTFTDAGTEGYLDGSFAPVNGTAGANQLSKVGYIGPHRYVKAVMTVAAGTTGAVSSMTIVRGHPDYRPV